MERMIIFDMDGTILDNSLIDNAIIDFFKEITNTPKSEVEDSFKKINSLNISTTSKITKLYSLLSSSLTSPTIIFKLEDKVNEIYKDQIMKIMPLINQIKNKNIKIMLVTDNQGDIMEGLIPFLSKTFDVVIYREKNNKLQKARYIKDNYIKSKHTIVIGDNEIDKQFSELIGAEFIRYKYNSHSFKELIKMLLHILKLPYPQKQVIRIKT